MLLWLVLAGLTAAAVLCLVAPLLRGGRPGPDGADYDLAVYRDQLTELDRERRQGIVPAVEAAAARLEIERRILAAAGRRGPAAGAPAAGAGTMPWQHLLPAAALALAVPALSLALYIRLGAPGLPDLPLAGRGVERAILAADGSLDLPKVAAELRRRLQDQPNSVEGWTLLARTEASLEQWPDAADSFRRAIELTGGRSDLVIGYGEVLMAAAGGLVTPAAQAAFRQVLAREPDHPRARYQLALGKAQTGDLAGAVLDWLAIEAASPADAAWRPLLAQRIAEAAARLGITAEALRADPAAAAKAPAQPGPGAAEASAIAALPPEQRAEAIRGMVEGLAARLAQAPDDPEGWRRLGRAYTVLGDPAKALDAYARAAELRPGDVATLLDHAHALRDGPAADEAGFLVLMRRIEGLDPRQPEPLWYLGRAAAEAGRPREAEGYWRRLLALLDPGSADHGTVAGAIAGLPK